MEQRNNHQLTSIDAGMSYIAALCILMFIGRHFHKLFGFYGLAVTQITIIIVPFILMWIRRDRIQDALSLKLPKGKHLLGSMGVWLGLFLIVNGVTQLLMPLSDYNIEVAQQLAEMTYHPNLVINLVVIALMPAVCEEILFRGVIFKGISNRYNSRVGIVVSSILFGMLHFDWIRMVPTTILGLGICYVVYKSGSILLGMLMHFINNGFVVIVGHLANPVVKQVEMPTEGLWQGAIIFIVVGAIIVWMCKRLFGKNNRILI